jgi:hypothetical protein
VLELSDERLYEAELLGMLYVEDEVGVGVLVTT